MAICATFLVPAWHVHLDKHFLLLWAQTPQAPVAGDRGLGKERTENMRQGPMGHGT